MCRHRQTQSRRYYKIQWIIKETFSNVVTQDQQSVRRSKKGYKKCDWVTALTILCKERCEIELNWHTSASIAIGILAVAEASEEIISRQRVFKVSECPRDYQTYSKWIIINLSGCLHGSVVWLFIINIIIYNRTWRVQFKWERLQTTRAQKMMYLPSAHTYPHYYVFSYWQAINEIDDIAKEIKSAQNWVKTIKN